MPRDYAKKPRPQGPRGGQPTTPAKSAKRPAAKPRRATAPRRGQSGGLSLKWILSLAAVGGFIGFIAYLNSLPAPAPDRPAPPAPAKQAPKTEAPTAREDGGFRFYDILPDSEVVPPKVEEYSPAPADPTTSYLVQTGSFRSQQDAERQRAQIAFQGLRAQVDRIDLDNGTTWYRVNVGPFDSRSQMNAAIDKLVAINIQPLVRRIPKKQG